MQFGQGLQVDGSGQWVDAGNWNGTACFVNPQTCTTGFTVMTWIKIRSDPDRNSGLFSTVASDKQGVMLELGGAGLHAW